MGSIQDFEYHVWQQAHDLSEAVMRLSQQPLVRGRRFFADQICDAAVSALAGVSFAPHSREADFTVRAEFIVGLAQARESLTQLKELLEGGAERAYVSAEDAEPLVRRAEEVSAMVLALSMQLRRSTSLHPERRGAWPQPG